MYSKWATEVDRPIKRVEVYLGEYKMT